jgi:hypothetical protein
VRWVTEAVNGITRWRRRLDYILGALLNRDPATLDAPLRQILRLGLYELAEMRCECCAARCALCSCMLCMLRAVPKLCCRSPHAVHGTAPCTAQCTAVPVHTMNEHAELAMHCSLTVLLPVLPTVLQPRCTP